MPHLRLALVLTLSLTCLLRSSPAQVQCASEHNRLRGLLNGLRELEGLPPLPSPESSPKPIVQGPLASDPTTKQSSYDAAAVAEWHKEHDGEVPQLKAKLASPDCAPLSPSPDAESLYPYDLIYSQVDDTGIPLFPVWKSSIAAPYYSAPDPSQCGNGDPWMAPCTSQQTEINNNTGLCPVGKLGGHANWIPATYLGRITWESHSLESQDDDYNFNLLPLIPQSPLPWITSSDNAAGLHLEFSSDETIDHFHTPWWASFHAAVDDDDSRSMDNPFGTPRREMVIGTSKALAMVRGVYAIVSGLMGLDCAHSCGAEIHPVWALAMHVQDDASDDVWSFFARNTGNEGYCASNSEWLNTQHFTFRLPWRPGATDVQITGQDFRWKVASTAGGTYDPRPDENAILVTLNVAPPNKGDRVNGELHLKWTGSPQHYFLPASAMNQIVAPESKREDDAEVRAASAFHNLNAAQRAVAARKLPKRDTTADHQTATLKHSQAPPIESKAPQVTSVKDTRGSDRAKQRSAALRAANAVKVPKSPR
jgi:hypothetical protein